MDVSLMKSIPLNYNLLKGILNIQKSMINLIASRLSWYKVMKLVIRLTQTLLNFPHFADILLPILIVLFNHFLYLIVIIWGILHDFSANGLEEFTSFSQLAHYLAAHRLDW